MSNWRVAVFCLYNTAALAQIPGLQPENTWRLDGYIKQTVLVESPDQGASSSSYLWHNRLDLQYRPDRDIELNASMRNRLLLSDRGISSAVTEQYNNDVGYVDMSANWLQQAHSVGNSQLDRLYLQWQQQDWRVRGGRFRINWAMNTVWNPNDLFNSYSLFDVDYAEKPGADAVMLRRALGFVSELELAVTVSGPDGQGTSVAGKYRFNRQGWDGQLIAGVTDNQRVTGAGASGSVGEAAVRAEVSYFRNDAERGMQQENSVVASIEADYSFASQRNWAVKAASLYIEKPYTIADAAQFLARPLTARSLSFARYSLYGELSFDLMPLSRVSLSAICYQDGSRYLALSDTYSLSDNWQLSAMLQRYTGSDDSLFGRQPTNTFRAQIRWDF